MLLQGLFVPLTEPFYRDGVSYLRKLEHNVARYSLSPAAGLIALPPGGESEALSDEERRASLKSVADLAAKEKILVAGVARASVYGALEMAQAAFEAGFDAILLSPPSDWARLVQGEDARELLFFYEGVADRSPLPVVLWSDARPPYLQLPVEVLGSLAQHRNVIGLIDVDLDVERLAEIGAVTKQVRREVTVTTIFEAVTRRMLQPEPESGATASFVSLEALSSGSATATATVPAVAPAPALKTRSKAVGFQILSGAPVQNLVPLLAAGAQGAAPIIAACTPQACFEAYAAWKDGDQPLAEERAERLRRAEELVLRLGPAAVKAGCDFNGYYGGHPRLPRLPLTAQDRAEIERALALIRN